MEFFGLISWVGIFALRALLEAPRIFIKAGHD